MPFGFPGGGAHEEPLTFSWADSLQRNRYVALLAVVSLLIYSFWNTLERVSAFWSRDQYSHGWIVPLIALYLLWARRPNPAAHEPPPGQTEVTFFGVMSAVAFRNAVLALAAALAVSGYLLPGAVPGVSVELGQLLQGIGLAVGCVGLAAYVLIGQPFQRVEAWERWVGLALVLAAYALRVVVGAQFEMEPVSQATFLAAMLGGLLLVGGSSLFVWAGPAVAFLTFMFPIPSFIEGPLLGGLQKVAAACSEVVLTILNTPVIRQGNQLSFSDMPDEQALFVAEACSGLRMLTIFGAMAVAMVFMINRPWWDKFIVLLSALPIALLVNITRIVVTALLYRAFPDGEVLHQAIHDYAGLAMMPVAMGLLYLLLRVLSSLTQVDEGIEMSGQGIGTFAAR
jgi:exosortase